MQLIEQFHRLTMFIFKLNGIDPFRYFRDILARVSTHPANKIAYGNLLIRKLQQRKYPIFLSIRFLKLAPNSDDDRVS